MNLKNLTTYIGSIPNVKVEVNDDYIVIKNHTVTFIQSLKQIATEDELKGAYDAVL